MNRRLPRYLLCPFPPPIHTSNSTISGLRRWNSRGHSLWLALLSLWGILIGSASFGQSIQWGELVRNITTIIAPRGLGLNAAGVWQATANLSNGGNVAMLNKFDVNRNRTYSTYIGSVRGHIPFARTDANNGSNYSTLFTTPDGTAYLNFRANKSTGQTGVIPTTAAAIMSMMVKPDNRLPYSFTSQNRLITTFKRQAPCT
jgi:hypothetical protein